MLSAALSVAAAVFGAIGKAFTYLEGAAQRKAGRQEQQLSDANEAVKTLERERDAALGSESIDQAAKDGSL